MRKFSEVLEEYLEERERQNSDYYDNRYIGDRTEGRYHMIDLRRELDEIANQYTTTSNLNEGL
jgi:predicted CopG family antitoxin